MRHKLTQSQQHTLIGTMLFGRCPIVYPATAEALKRAGLFKPDRKGNMMLTKLGLMVALDLYKYRTTRIVARTRAKIARLKEAA
jgi:hypothetical protein